MTLQTIFNTNPVIHLVRAIIVGRSCLCTINLTASRCSGEPTAWDRGYSDPTCENRLNISVLGIGPVA